MFRLTRGVAGQTGRAISSVRMVPPSRMPELPSSLLRTREFLREEYHRAFRHDHWNVGVVDAPISTFLDPAAKVSVRWLPSPAPGTYFADPFGIVRGDRTEILLEAYDFRSAKGVIASVRAVGGAEFTSPRVALDLPVHASYPFLVEHDETVYCIPETAHAGEIDLYEATEFPYRWRKAGTLLPEFAGVDPTIVRHDGRFWLFCTDLERGPFSDLHVWYANDLFGPWTPHAQNPVKSDVRSARPGGTPFRVGGTLYRPAQDCSSGYGGSITINRVARLTPEEFREAPIAVVRPFRDGPLTRGIHTLSTLGQRTLVDGKRVGFNASEMARAIRVSLDERWPRMVRRSIRGQDARSRLPPAASRGG